MYYTNGNYAAFTKPRKPKDADHKKAYVIGNDLSALAAAAFMIRDGYMKGENITILSGEDLFSMNSSLYTAAGNRPMEEHFECTWDLFHSIPSLDLEDSSVLDEFYWLNQDDPSSSSIRVMEKQGHKLKNSSDFGLTDESVFALTQLMLTPEESLNNKRIKDIFQMDFFKSNFWLLWRTTFSFSNRHSAMEMRRYLSRFIHHTKDFANLSFMKTMKYNIYNSFILPLLKYLDSMGVNFMSGVTVTNVEFLIEGNKKTARRILYNTSAGDDCIELSPEDLIYITLGDYLERSAFGDDDRVPEVVPYPGASWKLWKSIAAQSPDFGKPGVFCKDGVIANWESASLSFKDKQIAKKISSLTGRDPFSGKTVTGGPVTIKDSAWLLSWSVNRQPCYPGQDPDEITLWLYGLLCHKPGNYIQKPMTECTGNEIVQEWLYHLGISPEYIEELSLHIHCVPCRMPYITSSFIVHEQSDKPLVIPEGARNFAFLGNFALTSREISMTCEYQVRTAMEAVYTLLHLDRGIPEVFASEYDTRSFLSCVSSLMDGKKITDLVLPFEKRLALKKILKTLKGSTIEGALKEYGLL